MPTKIRLQRQGRKKRPFYYIVIADNRAPRDGKFIERIGSYNPVTVPATIEIETDRAIKWLSEGAQPTKTVRAILSYKGVMYKKHLLRGVAKGAFTAEDAEKRFEEWLVDHHSMEADRKKKLTETEVKAKDDKDAAIREVREAKMKEQAAAEQKIADEVRAAAHAEKVAAEADAPAAVAEATPEAAPAAEPVAEAPKAKAAPEPTAKATETPAETPVEPKAKAETKVETKAEAKAEPKVKTDSKTEKKEEDKA